MLCKLADLYGSVGAMMVGRNALATRLPPLSCIAEAVEDGDLMFRASPVVAGETCEVKCLMITSGIVAA